MNIDSVNSIAAFLSLLAYESRLEEWGRGGAGGGRVGEESDGVGEESDGVGEESDGEK